METKSSIPGDNWASEQVAASSLRDFVPHRSGRLLESWTREEVFEEMISWRSSRGLSLKQVLGP